MTHRLPIAATLALLTLPALADGPGLSLRIADEAAPAGSIVQIKVEVTEPKPISTGRGKVKVKGVAAVNGIVLMNEGQDTFGIAMVDGEDLTFAITSPSSLFGTPADYPILGIAGTIAASASAGTSFPLELDPSGLGFRDPSGAVYPTEIQNGRLTVANGNVTIGNVSPGSATVPAGGVVRISGRNFTPSTRIRLNETIIREQRFIDSNTIDVVLGEPRRMHGLRVRARNDEGNRSESEYFAYERTAPVGASNHALFSKTVPLFAPTTYNVATVALPRRTSSRKHRAVRPSHGSGSGATSTGIALQNLETANAAVSIELLDASGHPYAVNTVHVGPNQYLVREIGEVFGIVAPPSAFRIHSNVPIQVLGLAADHSANIAAALPPG